MLDMSVTADDVDRLRSRSQAMSEYAVPDKQIEDRQMCLIKDSSVGNSGHESKAHRIIRENKFFFFRKNIQNS